MIVWTIRSVVPLIWVLWPASRETSADQTIEVSEHLRREAGLLLQREATTSTDMTTYDSKTNAITIHTIVRSDPRDPPEARFASTTISCLVFGRLARATCHSMARFLAADEGGFIFGRCWKSVVVEIRNTKISKCFVNAREAHSYPRN